MGAGGSRSPCTESWTQLSSAAVYFNIAARSKVPVPVDDAEAHDRPHGLSYRAMRIAATYRVEHMPKPAGATKRGWVYGTSCGRRAC